MKMAYKEVEMKVFDLQYKGKEKFIHELGGEVLDKAVNLWFNGHYEECSQLLKEEILSYYAYMVASIVVVDSPMLKLPLMLRV